MKSVSQKILGAWNQPFKKAQEALARKKIVLSPTGWRDIESREHARAFTVAGITSADIVLDIWESLKEAQETGETKKVWADKLKKTMVEKGWGLSGYRLATIISTNITSANNAGRWDQQQRTKKRRPYLQYMNPDDESTTDICSAMSGKTFPVSSSVWEKLYPPNHFQCRSMARALTQKQVDRRGLKISTKAPKGVKPAEGFDYNVGEETGWKPDLKKYPEWLARQVKGKMKNA